MKKRTSNDNPTGLEPVSDSMDWWRAPKKRTDAVSSKAKDLQLEKGMDKAMDRLYQNNPDMIDPAGADFKTGRYRDVRGGRDIDAIAEFMLNDKGASRDANLVSEQPMHVDSGKDGLSRYGDLYEFRGDIDSMVDPLESLRNARLDAAMAKTQQEDEASRVPPAAASLGENIPVGGGVEAFQGMPQGQTGLEPVGELPVQPDVPQGQYSIGPGEMASVPDLPSPQSQEIQNMLSLMGKPSIEQAAYPLDVEPAALAWMAQNPEHPGHPASRYAVSGTNTPEAAIPGLSPVGALHPALLAPPYNQVMQQALMPPVPPLLERPPEPPKPLYMWRGME